MAKSASGEEGRGAERLAMDEASKAVLSERVARSLFEPLRPKNLKGSG